MNIRELFTERKWHREGSVFYYKQVFDNGSIYIYMVDHDKDFSHCWYEIFPRRVVADLTIIDGKLKSSETDFHVKYPSNEDFGKWAFCFYDKEAIEKALLEEWNDVSRPRRKTFNGSIKGIKEFLSTKVQSRL